jgi:hypothetical protein
MRILDNRYSRDLRRHDLALRMIRHEVRTVTIRTWTGLSDTRIRSLFRSYLNQGGISALRHRGPPPKRVEPILRSKSLSAEASALAGMCLAIGVLPAEPLANPARELPSLTAGERLCYAFELYHQMVPKSQITLDQLVLLVTLLAQRIELALSHCDSCDAAIVVMLLSKPNRVCAHCVQRARFAPEAGNGLLWKPHDEGSASESDGDPLEGVQRRLF